MVEHCSHQWVTGPAYAATAHTTSVPARHLSHQLKSPYLAWPPAKEACACSDQIGMRCGLLGVTGCQEHQVTASLPGGSGGRVLNNPACLLGKRAGPRPRACPGKATSYGTPFSRMRPTLLVGREGRLESGSPAFLAGCPPPGHRILIQLPPPKLWLESLTASSPTKDTFLSEFHWVPSETLLRDDEVYRN